VTTSNEYKVLYCCLQAQCFTSTTSNTYDFSNDF